jgi:hypothetical protein
MNTPPAKDRPRIVAGIDEAGLGPLLGPLTFGFATLRLPPGEDSVWKILEEVVSEDPKCDSNRIIVADSKRVHSRNPRGRRRLETTVLSFLDSLERGRPRSGADLLRTAPEAIRPRAAEIARHPWYRELPAALPVWVDEGRLELRAERLRQCLDGQGIALLDAGVRVVPAGELNRSFAETGNKGRTVWELVRGIIEQLWLEFGPSHLHLIVDRQGGRFHYASLLARAFPDARLQVGVESPDHSEYQLQEEAEGTGRSMWITFAEKAENRAFSVALASCLAKYARELSMSAFNRYFGALQPDLTPTAGYTTDGRRWVRDATPLLKRAGIDREILVRQR